jgi:DNA-directed RNA polymerase subunit RPC12/RpoP/membrane protein implicated in regulation of membrane protease activity
MIQYFNYIGFGFIALSILNRLVFEVLVITKGDRAKRYRYVSDTSVNNIRTSLILLAASIFFFAFMMVGGFLGLGAVYQYAAAGFMAFLISFLFGSGFAAYAKYYFPTIMEKRLKNIRFKPMKSPTTGKKMRLLNELEEDEYLTQEMIEQEDNLETDYDVWFIDDTKETVIMSYDITDDAFVCDNCNFRTLKIHKEEVLDEPTYSEPGKMHREYRCTYCGHKEHKDVKIPSGKEKREIAGEQV